MPKYSKNYYKQLIAHDKIEQLTEELLQDLSQYLALANDAPLQNTYDQLIMLSGKLKGLQQQEDLNIANPLTAPIEKSRIDRALMRLINGLPQHFFDFLNSDRQSLPPARPDLRQQITDIHNNSHFEYDVFLSFSSQDLAEAQAVAEELRGYGLSLFLSDEVLKANTGSSFFEKIDYALHHSQHFVLLSSPAAMVSEWVKTEYETFFNEYHIKNKRQRRFIVLKSQAFQLDLVPRLLRRLQFAATAKDILETFVQDKAFQERQRAKAAKKAEEKAKAEEAAKRAAEAKQLRLLEEQRQAEQRELERQALEEKARRAQAKQKQKALEEKQKREEAERLNRQARREKEQQQKAEQERKAKEERQRKKAAQRAAWLAFFNKNGKKMAAVLLGLMLVLAIINIVPNWGASAEKPNGSLIPPIKEKPKTNSLSPIIVALEKNMVTIPAGTFMMGCTTEQGEDCDDDEKPAHSVTLRSFEINKYEVTQEEWQAVMGKDPPKLRFKACDKCPVERVSWNDIQAFLKKLNQLTGKNYRLPTEAEWEYAARGGENYKYAGSNTIGEVAWYDDNSGGKTHPVGKKQANGYGLFDMSGNVWEWCQDKWHDNYNKAPDDGRAWETGNSSFRVLRGGSWYSRAWNCRVADRDFHYPDSRLSYYGFRLAHR